VPGGERRTQNLTGGLLATAPFHWDGAFANIESLVQDVLVGRMGGLQPTPEQNEALKSWLDGLPRSAPRFDSDGASVARGRLLFEGPELGCVACHSGERLTNGANADVGTGGFFQVPSLTGVAARAPYLHNGCAATLEERFGPCGGGDLHGHTSQLSPQQVSDVIAFLKTL